MCGIVGYIGSKTASPILIRGLEALEYRGYDSAGIAVCTRDQVNRVRSSGEVATLKNKLTTANVPGTLGIAHTRWATHGLPTEENAHPHTDCSGRVFLVHNGIIENHQELKERLLEKGHIFKTQTDTEIIAHCIEDHLSTGLSFRQAVSSTLGDIEGAYALVVFDAHNPNVLYATRLSSPLVIGVGNNGYVVASDTHALIGEADSVVYLNDGELAEISPHKLVVMSLDHTLKDFETITLEQERKRIEKGEYDSFMSKEIHEGPSVVRAAIAGRLRPSQTFIKLGGLDEIKEKMHPIEAISITACGTSYYAGLVGKYLFEDIATIATSTEVASEFRYQSHVFKRNELCILLSQSGETADTLGAIGLAKKHNILTFGVVNVVGSTIAREVDAGAYTHAGPEISVASTKAFLSQLAVLTLMALSRSKLPKDQTQCMMFELECIPEKIKHALTTHMEVARIAQKYKNARNFFFIGRGYNYPVALEGALKLKEISYIHAEGYASGELKHGPIALVDEILPTVAIVTNNQFRDKVLSNIEEIKARGGPVIAIATEGDTVVERVADDVVYIPETTEQLEPFLTVVPLQLLAYSIATELGRNVDKPRNLAKSVTVE